jgi:hypothetical protein
MPDSEQQKKPLPPEPHPSQIAAFWKRFSAQIADTAAFLGIWRRKRMEITRTTTIEIRSEAVDTSNGKRMPPSCVWSEITSDAPQKQRKSRSEQRAERNSEDPVYERSPSPQRFADLGFAQSGKVIGIPPPPPKPPVNKRWTRTRAVELQVLPQAKDKSGDLAKL